MPKRETIRPYPQQTRNHRTLINKPGMVQKNVQYWPGFDEKRAAPLHLLSTDVDEFGGSLDTYPTYYGSPESESPGQEGRDFRFPGTIVKYSEPPIEPNSIYDAYKKPVRGVVEIKSANVATKDQVQTADQDEAYEMRGLGDITPAEVIQQVEDKISALPPAQQAQVDKPSLITQIWNQYASASAKAKEELRNPLTNRVEEPEPQSKGFPLALGILAAGIVAAIWMNR